jgi:HAE1 family hydrophobic/amphiphilic exporter-1
LGLWGIARLPTGFIPNDDQGYAMIAVQLPDGASLERTKATLDQVTKVAYATPGVENVIAIAGQSLLDNSASLANGGIEYVIFKDWSLREKAKGQDILSILQHLQRGLGTISDGKAFALVPPPIQGIGNAGGFQMQVQLLGGSFNYQKLSELTGQIVHAANADPKLEHVLTTFRAGSPHVAVTVDRNPQSFCRRRFLDTDILSGFDLRQPVQQVWTVLSGIRASRLPVSAPSRGFA